MQRVAGDGVMLNSAQLLYLATRAGAEALGLDGRRATSHRGNPPTPLPKPVAGSPLAMVAAHAHSAEDLLSALLALGRTGNRRPDTCARTSSLQPLTSTILVGQAIIFKWPVTALRSFIQPIRDVLWGITRSARP